MHIKNEKENVMIELKEKLNKIIETNYDKMIEWINSREDHSVLPFYFSVDIRRSSFKQSVIDTNLFPAGFNNLCKSNSNTAIELLNKSIQSKLPHAKHILLVAEEHTRNTWYLENLRSLKQLIDGAGYETTIASFFETMDNIKKENSFILRTTASNNPIIIHSISKVLDNKENPIDLILLNNDLTKGIPEPLLKTTIPIFPHMEAGWHNRKKSTHFIKANALLTEFATEFAFDPWLISGLYTEVKNININQEQDRETLYNQAIKIIPRIQEKYKEYNINETPFLFLKANSGTYGMGVMPIEKPEDILSLNRKQRNKLYKGKSSQVIHNYLIQEGIPGHIHNPDISETCVYQIRNEYIGSFYRNNPTKSPRENLNSQGMQFTKICQNPTLDTSCIQTTLHNTAQSTCGIKPETNIAILKLLAKLAGLAAQKEIEHILMEHHK